MKKVALATSFLLVSFCSGAWGQVINVAGSWRVTAPSSIYPVTSTAIGTINQNGTSLSGQFTITGTPCSSQGTFTGTLSGSSMTLNVNENGQIVVLTGTVAADGNSASGTYQAPSGGCTAGDYGTWSGIRVVPPVVQAVVNAASYQGSSVSPGSLVAVFGTNLAPAPQGTTIVPLPTSISGVSARFNSIYSAPLLYVSPGQINMQMPWELTGQPNAMITVTSGGITSSFLLVTLSSAAPAIFTTNSQGTGQGEILIAGTASAAAPPGSLGSRPARRANRGEFISIYCTGLGNVTNRPASGAAGRSNPLSNTLATPTVTIGGVEVAAADIQFSGLAPFFVGLYQVNVKVPANASTGDAVQVVLAMGGVASNTATIAVQ